MVNKNSTLNKLENERWCQNIKKILPAEKKTFAEIVTIYKKMKLINLIKNSITFARNSILNIMKNLI